MHKVFAYVSILAIGLCIGVPIGTMLQTTQTSQSGEYTETEGKVIIIDIACLFSNNVKLQIILKNNFTERVLNGNVTVYQDGRKWTNEVDWYTDWRDGYGYAEIACNSLNENQSFLLKYIEKYPSETYLDRVVEWDEVRVEKSFVFMSTEQLEIQGCTFSGMSGSGDNTIVLAVQNSGSADLTVDKYKLGVSGTQHDITDVAVAKGASTTVTCTTGADGQPWTTGTTYDIYLITSTGKQFPYRATAP